MPVTRAELRAENEKLRAELDIYKKDGEGDRRQIHGLQEKVATLELQNGEARRLLSAMQGVQISQLGYCFDECGEDPEIHTEICKRVTDFLGVTEKPNDVTKCCCDLVKAGRGGYCQVHG